MGFIRTSLLLWVLGSWASEGRGQASSAPFLVNDTFRETTLHHYLYLKSTSDAALTLRDVQNEAFVPVHAEILNVGFDPRYHWVKCQIRNVGNQAQALVFGIDFVHIDDLSFYIVDKQDTILQHWEHLNRHTPLAQRPLASRVFAFPFTISPGQTLTLYGRFFRQNSVLLLPIKLLTREAFVTNGFSFDLVMFMGLGVLLIAFLTSFTLFLATRQWVLFYYSLYVLSYGIATLSLEGVWSQYVPNVSFLDENTHLVMFGIVAFAQLQFTLAFLQLASRLPKPVRLSIHFLSFVALVVGLYGLVTPFSYANSSVVSGIGLATELIVFVLILLGLAARKAEATLYLVGFLPLLVVIVWFALTVAFDVPRSWLFYQLAYAIPFWQLIVLGIGLGWKLLRDQKQALLAVGILKRQQAEAIIQTQETERQRLAADLHDDLGGTLATIRRRLSDIRQRLRDPQAAQEMDALEPLIQKSGHDLRRIAHNLMPPEFERIGLRHALQQFIASQPTRPTRFSFIVAGGEQKLPLDTELNIYRIVSELVQNIHKHAQARQAAVQLLYYDNYLSISVEDDGVGSRVVKSEIEDRGIGLKNSSFRAEYIGAKLSREVSASGTLILLDVPFVITPDVTSRIDPNPAN